MPDFKNIESILKKASIEAIEAISRGRSGLDLEAGGSAAGAMTADAAGTESANLAAVALAVESPAGLRFSLRATRPLLLCIASAALDMDESEIGPDEYMDTAAEILNVAAGACAKKVLAADVALRLGLPQKNRDWEGGGGLIAECRFTGPEGKLIVFSAYAP